MFRRRPTRSASKEGTSTGPQEATQAGPDASPKTNASLNANAVAMFGNLALANSSVCDVTHALVVLNLRFWVSPWDRGVCFFAWLLLRG